MNLKDVRIEYTKGKGPGGQHKNKVETACRVVHIPTGTTVFIDGRSRAHYTVGSWHVIDNPMIWHKVVPLVQTYTIMVNGPPYTSPLPAVRTTAGKDLDRMTPDEITEHLNFFRVHIGSIY